MLTRFSGGDLLYASVLKYVPLLVCLFSVTTEERINPMLSHLCILCFCCRTLDAISFQKAALDSKFVHPEPQRWFLSRLFEEHQKLCSVYSSIPQEDRKPMMISIGSLEVGKKSVKHLNQVDTANYLIPTSLLAKDG